jgi:predicted ATPase/DNA-binding CsgD family transcriptional regulator
VCKPFVRGMFLYGLLFLEQGNLPVLDTPNNLPQQLTTFVGRKREIEEVGTLVEKNRLVTIIGAGGLGKTRLALEVASRASASFPGGIWFADLSEIPSDERRDLAGLVMSALGHEGIIQGGTLHALAAFFRNERTLLILDNCEHLVGSCASLAQDLLSACPGLHILATSRQSLNISGEALYRLQPLAVPGDSASYKPQALGSFEAIELFMDRARSRRGDFELTSRNSQAIADLCRALDGMPLAIELAAACLKVLSVEQIVERLDDRFRLLSWGSRTSAERQQSLQALIDWSHDDLPAEEQRVFRTVSVFRGGFTLEACAAVLDAPESRFIISLAALVDKSLVIHNEVDGASRYVLLETVRYYALERLKKANEENQVRDRHLDFYLSMAEQAAHEFNGQAQADWVRKLGSEYSNLKSALTWAGEAPAGAPKGLRIAWALKWFWVMHGRLDDARASIAGVIDVAGAGDDSSELSRGLNTEALLSWYIGDDEAAGVGYEQALAMARRVGDKESASFALKGLGNLARRHGNNARARALCEEALHLDEQIGDQALIALSLLSLGRVAVQKGTYREATRWLNRSLAMFQDMGDPFGVASARYELALVAVEREVYGKALDLAVSSLEIFRDLGVKFRAAQCLFLLGQIAASTRQAERAAVLYGAAETFLTDIGSNLAVQEQTAHERHEAAARILISNSAWDAAWYKGAAMDLNQALAYARAMRSQMEDGMKGENGEEQPHMALSHRELEVLRLVAGDLTSPEIAARLSISARTVEAHVQSIFSKLEIKSRKELARYAQENNLI